MTYSEREKLIKQLLKECKKIRKTKGADYSLGDKDANRNFKKVAEVLGISPEMALLVYVQKHLDAVYSFVKNGHLKGEGIEEKIKDIVNYFLILYTLLKENGKIS